MSHNILYVLPALIAAGSLFVFFIIEGPRNIVHGITGWAMGLAELHTAQGNATIVTSTAPYAGPRAAAETEALTATAHYAEMRAKAEAEKAVAENQTLTATAHYAEMRAKAEAERAEADAKAAKTGACKVQVEAALAAGINRYDVGSVIGNECRTLIGLK